MDFFEDNSATSEHQLELSDPALIAACISNPPRSRRPYRRRPQPGPVSSRAARRCSCGICPTCQENARWERIFREKFEDPNYYKSRPRLGGSSLGWL